MRVDQVQKIMTGYMQNSGRGGFLTGKVTSISPLTIQAGKLSLDEASLYITDNCIGLVMHLEHSHICSCGETDKRLRDWVILREPFKVGDGVLLLSRPDNVDGVKYIVLDRIQPYVNIREVVAR